MKKLIVIAVAAVFGLYLSAIGSFYFYQVKSYCDAVGSEEDNWPSSNTTFIDENAACLPDSNLLGLHPLRIMQLVGLANLLGGMFWLLTTVAMHYRPRLLRGSGFLFTALVFLCIYTGLISTAPNPSLVYYAVLFVTGVTLTRLARSRCVQGNYVETESNEKI